MRAMTSSKAFSLAVRFALFMPDKAADIFESKDANCCAQTAKEVARTRRRTNPERIIPSSRFVPSRGVACCTQTFQIRRSMLGKSSQTFTPQKCEPSVQIGVEIPARKWHGGPM